MSFDIFLVSQRLRRVERSRPDSAEPILNNSLCVLYKRSLSKAVTTCDFMSLLVFSQSILLNRSKHRSMLG